MVVTSRRGGRTRRAAYIIPRCEMSRLRRRARAAQRRDQSEVCGLLLCDTHRRLKFRFLKNDSKQPGSFFISAPQLKNALTDPLPASVTILGSFHSHPVSEAVPGPGDLERAFFKGYELIYDVCGREARLWKRVKNGRQFIPNEVPLQIIP